MKSVVGLVSVLVVGSFAALALAGEDVRLYGAGATFPQPLYERWVVEYQKQHPDVKVDYRAVGSGAGIKAITDKTVHFAGSDAPLNKKEREAMSGAGGGAGGGEGVIVQFPASAGGVVPAYNLPGVKERVNFTGEILADVYLGLVTKWNDPRLAEINKGVALPDLAITPAWRSDGSGTTFVFTSYLASVSKDFRNNIGLGKSVNWKVGQGGKGNPGVAAIVQQTPGALGYIELNFATGNQVAFGTVRNREGEFVAASAESISLAGSGAAELLKGTVLAADIWDQPGKGVYPISAFTYLIIYKDLGNLASEEEAKGLVGFFLWAVTEGQGLAGALDYAPLAEPVRQKSLGVLKQVTFKGRLVPATAPAAPKPE